MVALRKKQAKTVLASLAKNWERNPFTSAITLEKAQFGGNESKNMFLVQ